MIYVSDQLYCPLLNACHIVIAFGNIENSVLQLLQLRHCNHCLNSEKMPLLQETQSLLSTDIQIRIDAYICKFFPLTIKLWNNLNERQMNMTLEIFTDTHNL